MSLIFKSQVVTKNETTYTKLHIQNYPTILALHIEVYALGQNGKKNKPPL